MRRALVALDDPSHSGPTEPSTTHPREERPWPRWARPNRRCAAGPAASRPGPSTGSPRPNGTASLAAGHALVPGQLPVLHDPDRLRRPRPRPVPGLVDPGRRARHLVRHAVHGVPRHPGPGVRPAADDPVRGPSSATAASWSRCSPCCSPTWPSTWPTRCCWPAGCTGRSAGTHPGRHRHRDRWPRRWPSSATTGCTGCSGSCWSSRSRATRSSRSRSWSATPAARRPPHAGFVFAAFMAQFSVAAAYNITYAPYVSDYSRYMPRDTPPRSDHRRGVLRRLRLGDLADRAGRLAGHPAGRQRRPGRPAEVRRQRGRRARLDHRVPVRGRAAGHDGHERVRRHADRAHRRRLVQDDPTEPGLARRHHRRARRDLVRHRPERSHQRLDPRSARC